MANRFSAYLNAFIDILFFEIRGTKRELRHILISLFWKRFVEQNIKFRVFRDTKILSVKFRRYVFS